MRRVEARLISSPKSLQCASRFRQTKLPRHQTVLDPAIPTGEKRSVVQLLGSFGELALSLALVDSYRTVTFAAMRRTKEIAIRIALGARPAQILWLVLHQSVKPVLAGLLLGVPLAIAASGVVRSLLFQVHMSDPVTYTVISLVLLGTALIAAYVPARRGSNISAAIALKYE